MLGEGAVSHGLAVPEAKVLLENRFLGQNHIGQTNYLLRSERWIGMSSKIGKIINGVEDCVNRK
jgi:hypothetical protein